MSSFEWISSWPVLIHVMVSCYDDDSFCGEIPYSLLNLCISKGLNLYIPSLWNVPASWSFWGFPIVHGLHLMGRNQSHIFSPMTSLKFLSRPSSRHGFSPGSVFAITKVRLGITPMLTNAGSASGNVIRLAAGFDTASRDCWCVACGSYIAIWYTFVAAEILSMVVVLRRINWVVVPAIPAQNRPKTHALYTTKKSEFKSHQGQGFSRVNLQGK